MLVIFCTAFKSWCINCGYYNAPNSYKQGVKCSQKVHYCSQKVHYYPVQALCGADLTDPQEVQEASISLKNSIAVAISALVDNF